MKGTRILQWMLIAFTFFYSNFSLYSQSESKDQILSAIEGCDYVFCVDGGGSKTALQVLDSSGGIVTLDFSGEAVQILRGECSNIVVVKETGVKAVFDYLFKNLKIPQANMPLSKVVKKCAFVGGFAGLGRSETKAQMLEVVQSCGFLKENIALYSDAELALELVADKGAVLIGGTGSICFIKNGGELSRYGGLGYRLGDAGSGYWIGLEAIKSTLESEYGYNSKTSLNSIVARFFDVSNVKNLIAPINGNEIAASQIASLTPFVFDEAWRGDEIAYQIIEKAAHELGDLLARGIENSEMKHCMTYLIGGLFQNQDANQFIHLLYDSPRMQQLPKSMRPILVNVSEKMFPVLVVQEKMRLSTNSVSKVISSLPVVQFPQQESTCPCNPEFPSNHSSISEPSKLARAFYRSYHHGFTQVQKQDLDLLPTLQNFIDQSYIHLAGAFVKTLKNKKKIFLIGVNSQAIATHDLARRWNKMCANNPSLRPYQDAFVSVEMISMKNLTMCHHELGTSLKDFDRMLDEKGYTSEDLLFFLSSQETLPLLEDNEFQKAYSKKYLYTLASESIENPCYKEAIHTLGPKNKQDPHFPPHVLKFCLGLLLNESYTCLAKNQDKPNFSRGLEQLEALERGFRAVSYHFNSFENIVKLQSMNFSLGSIKHSNHERCPLVTFYSPSAELKSVFDSACQSEPNFFHNKCSFIANAATNDQIYNYHLGPCCSSYERGQGDTLGSCKGQKKKSTETLANPNHISIYFLSSGDSQSVRDVLYDQFLSREIKGIKKIMIELNLESKSNSANRAKAYTDNLSRVVIDHIPYDPMLITCDMVNHQLMKLLSHGAWVALNRGYGEMMVDLFPTDASSMQRSLNMIRTFYKEIADSNCPLSEEAITYFLLRAIKYKNLVETQLARHVPAPAKIVFTMLEKECDVETAIASLEMNNENLALLMSDI